MTAEDWASDGTFKKTPANFLQIYSIHFRIGQSFRPAIFALMTQKSALMYEQLLAKVAELLPVARPQRIFVDYEAAAIRAYKDRFGGILAFNVVKQLLFRHRNLRLLLSFFSSNLPTNCIEQFGCALRN